MRKSIAMNGQSPGVWLVWGMMPDDFEALSETEKQQLIDADDAAFFPITDADWPRVLRNFRNNNSAPILYSCWIPIEGELKGALTDEVPHA